MGNSNKDIFNPGPLESAQDLTGLAHAVES